MLRKKVLDPGIGSRLYNSFPNDDHRDQVEWRIGKLAAACGVSNDTLRHYERKGVLKAARSTNGYRSYPGNALSRVQLVRMALRLGFTLDELGTVMKEREQGGIPCRRVRALAAAKLSSVESQLADLRLLRDELRRSLNDWDERLAKTDPSEPAGLLEALAASRTNQINGTSRPVLGRRNLKRIGEKP
jgi:DNA-binding transcriptional MerR regulator